MFRSPAVHHPYQHRNGGVRPGHDSLPEETRRRTERVPAGVLVALPAGESHPTGIKVSIGLRSHDMEEAYHRRGYETVEAAVGGGQPRGQALWGRRTLRSGARRTESTNATRDRNLLVITDCSNAFGAVERPAVLAEVASFVPALTPFVAKCYGTRPADVFFRMDSAESRTIPCSSGVQQGDRMGLAIFCF